MDALTALTIIGMVTVFDETVIRVSKARAGSAARFQSNLESMRQPLDDQARFR